MDISRLDYYGKRTIAVLFTAQSLFSAGNIMLFTVSSILAVRMGGSTLWTGVPMILILSGAALGAWPMGRFMDRYGRRRGLAVGQFCGVAGALSAGVAVTRDSLPLFLGGMFLLGFARGILDMGRYAAADANPPRLRARAISLVVLGGTAGAVAGPLLLKPVSTFETSHGMTAMSGPWFAMAGILCLCFLLVFTFLRPDPLEIARARALLDGSRTETNIKCRELSEIIRDRRFFLAVAAIVCGHLVMYLVMTITPVFMHECHHGITEISWVIFAHMFGMYGLSFFVGWLIDRAGRQIMIAAGCLVLIVSCLMAPMFNGTLWLALVLFLVGLGWNCCFVSGSTLLRICCSLENGGEFRVWWIPWSTSRQQPEVLAADSCFHQSGFRSWSGSVWWLR